jgi:hypothetical protein
MPTGVFPKRQHFVDELSVIYLQYIACNISANLGFSTGVSDVKKASSPASRPSRAFVHGHRVVCAPGVGAKFGNERV